MNKTETGQNVNLKSNNNRKNNNKTNDKLLHLWTPVQLIIQLAYGHLEIICYCHGTKRVQQRKLLNYSASVEPPRQDEVLVNLSALEQLPGSGQSISELAGT